ncbi:hypothetical protein A3Q56_06180 [Intoshia linei]|uniref:Uncharacterized protein n=1 Tax=Intoshia linei TaxID=1819745 RepID=A0A177AW85_9BILA|nr:hypothetical protein A3Q56_06180 [Intoshia linei]
MGRESRQPVGKNIITYCMVVKLNSINLKLIRRENKVNKVEADSTVEVKKENILVENITQKDVTPSREQISDAIKTIYKALSRKNNAPYEMYMNIASVYAFLQ